MKTKSVLALLLIGLSVSLVAKADDYDYEQLEVSTNLSQLIRSNSNQYWSYMRAKADLGALGPYLKFEGTITGDPHMGNFSLMPVADLAGNRVMRFLDVDFDDAGQGPFVLDFVRFAITAKATNDRIKVRELLDAYRMGLAGKSMTAPDEVVELMATPLADYDQMAADYVTEHAPSGRIALETGKIEAYAGPITTADIAAVFPGYKILDVAQHLQTRGGSLGETRLWVLVADTNGRLHIMELKQRAESGLSKFEPQPAIDVWWANVRNSFWPGLNTSAYDLVQVGKAGYFWKREKHKSLIDIPYTSEKKKKRQFVHDLALFDANFLGLTHARQAQAAAYAASIEGDDKAFHAATDELVKMYLNDAQTAFSANPPPQSESPK